MPIENIARAAPSQFSSPSGCIYALVKSMKSLNAVPSSSVAASTGSSRAGLRRHGGHIPAATPGLQRSQQPGAAISPSSDVMLRPKSNGSSVGQLRSWNPSVQQCHLRGCGSGKQCTAQPMHRELLAACPRAQQEWSWALRGPCRAFCWWHWEFGLFAAPKEQR